METTEPEFLAALATLLALDELSSWPQEAGVPFLIQLDMETEQRYVKPEHTKGIFEALQKQALELLPTAREALKARINLELCQGRLAAAIDRITELEYLYEGPDDDDGDM